MEDHDKPRRDLKSLWMVPILALGVGTLIATRKQLAPAPQPTKSELSHMAKLEAYHNAKYLVMIQMLQKHIKSVIVIGFGPDSDGVVTELGRNRFHCAGLLTARSHTGIPLRERWQCIITGSQTSWTCESFQELGWQRVLPSRIGRDVVGAENRSMGKRE